MTKHIVKTENTDRAKDKEMERWRVEMQQKLDEEMDRQEKEIRERAEEAARHKAELARDTEVRKKRTLLGLIYNGMQASSTSWLTRVETWG